MFFLLSLSTAVLLWAAFPPINVWPLVWVALAPLLFLLDNVSSKRAAFGWSWLTGFAFFMGAFSWIRFVSTFGAWLAWLGLVLLAAYLAIYSGLFGVAAVLMARRWRSTIPPVFYTLCLAAFWSGLEVARGVLFTGFNWGSLGHAQPPGGIGWLASCVGVPGVSLVVVAFNIFLKDAVAEFVKSGQGQACRRLCIMGLVVVAMAGAGIFLSARDIPGKVAGERHLRVAVIQPNIPLAQSWDPAAKSTIVHKLLTMSGAALLQKPGLIVWPETSFPSFYWEMPELFGQVKDFARVHQVPLLIGTIIEENGKYYNAAMLIGPDGNIERWHAKQHLVIFGEYIPLRHVLPFLSVLAPIDDFTPGPEEAIFDLPDGTRFGVLICFEDTVPELARRYARAGAQFFVNMTNDAWFHESGEPRMHLDNARFRAVENRMPLVRATNTGESCFIDRHGRAEACVADANGRRVRVEGVLVRDIFYQKTSTNQGSVPYTDTHDQH